MNDVLVVCAFTTDLRVRPHGFESQYDVHHHHGLGRHFFCGYDIISTPLAQNVQVTAVAVV